VVSLGLEGLKLEGEGVELGAEVGDQGVSEVIVGLLETVVVIGEGGEMGTQIYELLVGGFEVLEAGDKV